MVKSAPQAKKIGQIWPDSGGHFWTKFDQIRFHFKNPPPLFGQKYPKGGGGFCKKINGMYLLLDMDLK